MCIKKLWHHAVDHPHLSDAGGPWLKQRVFCCTVKDHAKTIMSSPNKKNPTDYIEGDT